MILARVRQGKHFHSDGRLHPSGEIVRVDEATYCAHRAALEWLGTDGPTFARMNRMMEGGLFRCS